MCDKLIRLYLTYSLKIYYYLYSIISFYNVRPIMVINKENAKNKIVKKGLDMVVLNDVSNKSIGFNSDDNEVSVYDKDGLVAHIEKQNKKVIATSLLELIFNAAKK